MVIMVGKSPKMERKQKYWRFGPIFHWTMIYGRKGRGVLLSTILFPYHSHIFRHSKMGIVCATGNSMGTNRVLGSLRGQWEEYPIEMTPQIFPTQLLLAPILTSPCRDFPQVKDHPFQPFPLVVGINLRGPTLPSQIATVGLALGGSWDPLRIPLPKKGPWLVPGYWVIHVIRLMVQKSGDVTTPTMSWNPS